MPERSGGRPSNRKVAGSNPGGVSKAARRSRLRLKMAPMPAKKRQAQKAWRAKKRAEPGWRAADSFGRARRKAAAAARAARQRRREAIREAEAEAAAAAADP